MALFLRFMSTLVGSCVTKSMRARPRTRKTNNDCFWSLLWSGSQGVHGAKTQISQKDLCPRDLHNTNMLYFLTSRTAASVNASYIPVLAQAE